MSLVSFIKSFWRGKSFVYRILLILTVLYLFWQISLSGAILSANTLEKSQLLSDLAQKTVGFGMALFVFRTGWQTKPESARGRLFLAMLIGVSLCAGYLAMWAEDFIVSGLAARATASERMEAKQIQLFNTAFLQNKVTLPDLAGEISSDHIKSRAFSKILGFSIWNNPALMKEIASRTSSVLNSLYGGEAYQKADENYEKYVQTWKDAHEKLARIEEQLSGINYAAYARDLNSQLAKYSACKTDDCRRSISSRVKNYLARKMPDLPFELNLDDFCREAAGPTRYVMGRAMPTGSELVCSTSEIALRSYVQEKVKGRKADFIPHTEELPPEIRQKLLNSGFLTLTAWRDLWKEHISSEVDKRKRDEFDNPERYGEGAPQAQEGRNYAIAVFLPPVALSFSIFVCFLHLASLCAMLFGHGLFFTIASLAVFTAPAFLATGLPLSGFTGVWAKWLVFWEGALYPFGIFRWLM